MATAILGLVSITGISVYFGLRGFNMVDFSQYYAGALVARSGDWSGLYPEPIPNNDEWNAGSKVSARPNPKYLQLARAEDIEPTHNFIQPPVAAILYSPLGWLPYLQAEWVWRMISGFAIWGMAIFSGLIARHLAGSQAPTISEMLTVAIVCLPNRLHGSLVYGNISQLVGLAIAAGVYFALKNRLLSGILWLGMAIVLKISPALLLVTLLIRARRKVLPGLLVLVGLILGSLLITGVEPWLIFVTEIAPTLKRPWLPGTHHSGCTTSIYGVAYYMTLRNPLPHGILMGIKALSFTVTGLVVFLWWMKRELIEKDDCAALAAFASATVVPLIFAPLTWPHYSYFLVVYTGWLLVECCKREGAERLLPALALFMMYAPPGWFIRPLAEPKAKDLMNTVTYVVLFMITAQVLLRSRASLVKTIPVPTRETVVFAGT